MCHVPVKTGLESSPLTHFCTLIPSHVESTTYTCISLSLPYRCLPLPQSELSDVSPSEQFTTSLGADQAVRITCQPVAVVHSNTRGLSKNKLLTYTHVVKVRDGEGAEEEAQSSDCCH